MKLDPSMGEAWTSKAKFDVWFDRDWTGGLKGFKRAIELNPNYPTAHHWKAVVLAQLGRLEEARIAIERAHELDPASLIIMTIAGWRHHLARDPEGALLWHRRSLEIQPEYPVGHLLSGQALALAGRPSDALAAYKAAYELEPESPVMQSCLAFGLALTGDISAGRALAERVEAESRLEVPPVWFAQAWVGLGDRDAAFRTLERGLEENSEMGNLFMEPLLDPLRDDPRYERLIDALGFRGLE